MSKNDNKIQIFLHLCFFRQFLLFNFRNPNIYSDKTNNKTIFTRQLTNRQRDHRLVGVRLDDNVFHDRSYRIMCLPSDVGGANVPTFTKTGCGHLVVSGKSPAETSPVNLFGGNYVERYTCPLQEVMYTDLSR